jgi:hypothetical protein
MATKAIVSSGATLKVKGGGLTTLTAIKGLKSFDGIGSGAAAVLDATDLDSSAKEKLAGLPDEGTMTLTFNFIADDAGQMALQKARDDQSIVSFEAAIKTQKYAFDGLVLTAAIGGIGVDSIVEMTVSVEITGKVTRTAVAATV